MRETHCSIQVIILLIENNIISKRLQVTLTHTPHKQQNHKIRHFIHRRFVEINIFYAE